jgi:hypothetical protein
VELALPEDAKSIVARANFGTEAETSIAVNPAQEWMSLTPLFDLQRSIGLRHL